MVKPVGEIFYVASSAIDMKVALIVVHMENEQFQWYQGMRRKRVVGTPYTWENLVRDITAQYDDIWDQDYFIQLTKIK